MKHIILCISAVILLLCPASAAKKIQESPRLFPSNNSVQTPLFIGHRGLQPFGPENSLPAFLAAGEHGIWAIETDFRMTRDGVAVCIHDAALDRTTTGTGNVIDHTFDELKSLKIKEVNSKGAEKLYDYASFTDHELRIPTMEEYFAICRRYGCVAFVELKEDGGVIEQMNRCIRKYQMEGRTVVSSSKMELLKAYRRTGDEYIHLIFGKTENIDELLKMGNAGIAFNIKTLSETLDLQYRDRHITSTAQLVALCHELGLRVCFRAVDNMAKASKCLEIMTDYMPTNTMWELKGKHYPYTGQKIDLEEKKFGLSLFLTKTKEKESHQGMDIASDCIFILENGGGCSVYDFNSRSSKPIAHFSLGSAHKDNHSNMANFGVETKPGASFPLLYVTVGKYNVPMEYDCHVESITRKGDSFSSELVQTITLDPSGFSDAGLSTFFGCPAWLVDRERGFLWVFSAVKRTLMRTTGDPKTNRYIATKFRIPKLSEGDLVTLTAADVLDQKSFEFDVFVTQGGCMRDGKIYYSFGFTLKKHPETPAQIRVFDTDTGLISSRIDLNGIIPEEMEDLSIYRGRMFANTNSKKLYVLDF